MNNLRVPNGPHGSIPTAPLIFRASFVQLARSRATSLVSYAKPNKQVRFFAATSFDGYEPEGREFESPRAHHSNPHELFNLSCNLHSNSFRFSRSHRSHCARNRKTSSGRLRYLSPKLHIFRQLGVAIGHRLLSMSKPESDEVFRCALLPKPRRAKSSHSMEACLLRSEFFQERMKRSANHVGLRFARTISEDKPRLTVSNKCLQQLGQGGAQVYLPTSIVGFR